MRNLTVHLHPDEPFRLGAGREYWAVEDSREEQEAHHHRRMVLRGRISESGPPANGGALVYATDRFILAAAGPPSADARVADPERRAIGALRRAADFLSGPKCPSLG
jgi:hypothetical protein